MTTAFYIAAAVAIVSTFMAITRFNAVHALLYLVVSLLSVALIFFLLGAPFVAALEVIIYAGAIMVLFVFVVMMLTTGRTYGDAPGQAGAISPGRRWLTNASWVGPAVLTMVLLVEFVYVMKRVGYSRLQIVEVTPKQVATVLLGPYLLGVELVSVLLLVGLVGAYHLARRPSPDKGSKAKGGGT
jgi:NADH-quinone oxidoreductase subunit J